MGKIVKFCTACDEGFAEKFAFCPNCGAGLQAFEMNPVNAEPEAKPEPEVPSSIAAALPAVDLPADSEKELQTSEVKPADQPFELDVTDAVEPETESVLVVDESFAPIDTEATATSVENEAQAAEEFSDEVETVTSYEVPEPASDAVFVSAPMDADARRKDGFIAQPRSGDFNVTVIEEKNVGTRNKLLAGTFGLMLVMLFSGLVYSIFSKDLEIGSINDDIFNAVLVEDVPAVIEDEAPKPKAKKDAGGGGGGGRDEKEETTRGDLADQTKTPVRPPDAKTPRMENPSIKLPPPSTEGDRKFEKKYDRWGNPDGKFDNFSNGTGTGGGQGSGRGTGQGSGRGTGAGSGIGSGSGGGLGSGNGDGSGRGNQGTPDIGEPPPPRPKGVTQQFRIVNKPRPGYTDAARQNNIQGTVVLRVTFLASGGIGDISPVKGLPNGLTEQAIAAARRIQFEPAKVDGVGRSVTRQIEYTFSIY